MTHRSKTGYGPTKAQHRKRASQKRGHGPKTHPQSSSIASLETRVSQLTQALKEALQQQSATADVLKVISRSAFDLKSVFDTLLSSAATLCGAIGGTLWVRDGDVLRYKSSFGHSPRFVRFLAGYEQRPSREMMAGRVFLSGKVETIPDTLEDKEYLAPTRGLTEARSVLGVPLLRDERVAGAIVLLKREPKPFHPRQIELVQTFADQAVIAVENTRLFGEIQEALQRETATSEILRVISQSPTDARPVFDAIVSAAVRSLRCDMAAVLLRDGDVYDHIAGATKQGRMTLPSGRPPIDPSANFPSRVFLAKETLYLPDWSQIDLPAHERTIQAALGVNSALYLPLLREGECIGLLVALGNCANAFGPTEIAQAESFRDQALIAIENARLFDQVQARTRDLEEALAQQTATADVLKVISRSAFDLESVLAALAASARELCGASFAMVHMRDGDIMRFKAHSGCTPEGTDFLRAHPMSAGRTTNTGLVMLTGRMVHRPDVLADPEYDYGVGPDILHYRAALTVPLLRDGRVEGVFNLARREPEGFTQRQIEMVQVFADQAVIAIENVRLFDEVQAKTRDLEEALSQQTATADVLKVISRSAFDLQAVFDTLISSAVELSGALNGAICLREGDGYRYSATSGIEGDFADFLAGHQPTAGRATIAGRVILSGRIEFVPDVLEDRDYAAPTYALNKTRSVLGVPLLRNDKVEGVLALARREPGEFTSRQVELVETFADQAVIAIENVRLFDEVQAKTRDLEEALAQQTATADVLKVISRSAFDLDAVLKTLTDSARSLSGAAKAAVFVRDGEAMRIRAESGFSPELIEYARAHPIRAGRETFTGRAALSGEVVHIPDVLADPDYDYGEAPRLGDYRAGIGVPLLRAGRVDGVFALMRPQPGAFTPRQIEMARAFADQAVIAIENARLFNEVQAKTRDLEEALQQQTATADVLKVISRSAFDLQAVLDTLITSAVKMIGAAAGVIALRDSEGLSYRATFGMPEEYRRWLLQTPFRAGRGTSLGRVLLTGEIDIIPDLLEDKEYVGPVHRLTGTRSILTVPLVRDGRIEVAFSLNRLEPGEFTARQIELVRTFADQALIAIENVRLFDEVQAKTRDLEESLQQQTATADVLKVISRSAFDLQAVLHTLVESAAKLCEADGAVITREVDRVLYRAESYGCSDEFMAAIRRLPVLPERGTVSGRVLLQGKAIQIHDIEADPEYALKEHAKMGGFRTCLGIPMLRNGAPIGVISLLRTKVHAFSDKQIELVQTFADQAVIAIENARLFDEVQAKTKDLEEALQQQTATANVLKVISRSAFDLQAVLTTLADSARELCGASHATVHIRDGEVMRFQAHSGLASEAVEFLRAHPIAPGRETNTGLVMLTGRLAHRPDVLADPEYDFGTGPQIVNYRAVLAVPLLRDGRVEGVFNLSRAEPGPFAQRQIEMVQAFADQAVIAIENSRLFNQLQARTEELAASLQNLRNAQDRLIQSEKLASLGQLTAGIAHEIKNPLNFVNNFSGMSRELLDELKDVLTKAPLDAATRHEADDLVATVASNLDKVVQHGRRADSIVKNMLLHSREGSGERTETNVNAMVEEALNLAYHGARAEKPDFNVTIVRELDPDAGKADLYPQEITRVLLNLISNGFYATTKRRQAGSEPGYEPTLTASTRNLGDHVDIAIKDNGAGIPDNVKEKMFNPFFTTKPAGEGTGLGLSLSHDIVVKQHGGSIDVEGEPGSTTFIIRLPRADPSAQLKAGGHH